MSRTVHEIRIHGVSGTPPAAMLSRDGDCEFTRVVSYTDPLTGFFTDPKADPDQGPKVPDRVEAYSWGGLTSNGGMLLEKVKRVGWLLLLPFAMVNVAYWTRPDIDKQDPQPGDTAATRRVTAVAVRSAALLLTMAAVAAVCLVSMDLLAWQCFRGGSRVCSLPGWAPQFVQDILGWPVPSAPSQRLVLAALVPLAAIALLVLLSVQSRARYEAVASSPGTRKGPLQGDAILQRRFMWRGETRIATQMMNHLTAALAVVTICLTAPIIVAAQQSNGDLGLRAGLLLAALSVLMAFLSAGLSWHDGIEFSNEKVAETEIREMRRRGRTTARTGLALGITAVVVAAACDWSVMDDHPVSQARDFFDGSLLLGGLFLALAAHVVFLAFASRSQKLGLFLALLLVAVPAVGVMFFSGGSRGESTNVAAWIAAGMVAAAAAPLLLWVHGRLAGKREGCDRQAWRGAAPAVVLGGAVGVGLLFTTSLLVGAADLLNGDQPVTATAAGYPAMTSPTALLLQDGSGLPTTPTQLTSTGPITVSDGEVRVWQGRPVVVRGTVSVSQLSTVHEGATRLIQGLVVGSGEPGLTEVRLQTQEAALALDNTCLGAACQATQGPPAVSQGSVPVGGGIVVLRNDVRVTVEDPPQETLVLPNALLWSTTLMPIWTVALVLMAVMSSARFRRAWGAIDDLADADIESQAGVGDLENDRNRITAARRQAALVHRAERLVGRAGVITAVAFALVVVGAVYGRPPWDRYEWLRPLADAGLYFALGLGLALLWFISQVRQSDSARRQAGILWDVATFLPRVAHPFGPPSYGERVVPEVTRRVRRLLHDGNDDDLVILSAHSQGSVIAVAVATRLSDDHLQRVRMVTYGSQLRAWFGRLFPAVLGPDQLGTAPLERMWDFESAAPDAPLRKGDGSPSAGSQSRTLRHRLGEGANWRNLYRRTDPIGFPIFADPACPAATDGDRYVFEIDERCDLSTHSGYQFTSDYQTVVADLLAVTAGAPGGAPSGKDE